jgi:threonine/homoserine/homoserine lactone efflux protein
MFGMGWVITRFPPLLDLLRYAGAAFLIVMGGMALRTKPAAAAPLRAPAEKTGGSHHYGIGVLTNILNPKALLYFMALCSTVITGATPVWLRIALGLWMVLFTAAWFCLVSFMLGQARIRQRLAASAHWIDRCMGVILLALGAFTILSGLGR